MESNLNQFQSIRDGIQLKIITGKYHRFQYSTLPPPSLLPPSSPPHKTVKSDKSNAILFVFINRLGKISRDCCRNGSNILRLLPIKKNRRRDSVAVIALNHPHQYTNCLRVCVCVCVCQCVMIWLAVSMSAVKGPMTSPVDRAAPTGRFDYKTPSRGHKHRRLSDVSSVAISTYIVPSSPLNLFISFFLSFFLSLSVCNQQHSLHKQSEFSFKSIK